jgi:hypothetical protein
MVVRIRYRAAAYNPPVIRVIVPNDKPDTAVRRWSSVLAFTKRVAKAERIVLDEIRLHHHPKGSIACFDAEASWEDHWIAFCGGQNRETALHELAHLVVEDYHSKTWATALMALHRAYLPPARCRRADRVLAIEYRSARPLYAARYGENPPPFKSDKTARRRARRPRRW